MKKKLLITGFDPFGGESILHLRLCVCCRTKLLDLSYVNLKFQPSLSEAA